MPDRRQSVLRGEKTRSAILDVAERLFAEHGYAAVSLRDITAAAGANVAAINYHFGSKERLFEAVFERRIRPINEERLKRLAACMAGPGEPDLACVVRTFVEPYIQLTEELGPGGAVVQQFLGRLFMEPGLRIQDYLLREFDAIWQQFSKALGTIFPGTDREILYWRFNHMMGVTYFYLGGRNWLKVRTNGLCDPDDVETTTRELVSFIVGGLAAPSLDAGRGLPAEMGASAAPRRARPRKAAQAIVSGH
jgi:AcrR family transcriptional regulator